MSAFPASRLALALLAKGTRALAKRGNLPNVDRQPLSPSEITINAGNMRC